MSVASKSVDRLMKENAKLREALEPFARSDMIEWADASSQDDSTVVWTSGPHKLCTDITYGDFRRARVAITAGERTTS